MNNCAGPRRRSRWLVLLGPSLLAASAMGVLAPPALAAGPGVALDVEPETQQVAVDVFTNFTLTATTSVAAPNGGSFNVDFEHDGANDPDEDDSPATPDYSCTIGGAARACTVTVPSLGLGTGTDTVYGWIDRDKANGTCEADRESAGCRPAGATVGDDDEGVADPGAQAEPDETDVVEVVFTRPSDRRLECSLDAQTRAFGQRATITCNFEDADGNPIDDIAIGGEFIAGPNDPDSAGQSNNGPRAEDITMASSVTSFTYTYLGTNVGTDHLCFWVESDGAFAAPSDDDADGPAEADGGQCARESNQGGDDPDFTDVVSVTWGSGDPTPCQGHCDSVVNVTVQKKLGKPKGGVTVNAGGVSCVTNRSGQCTLANLTGANVAVTNSRGYPCSPPTVSGAANVICSKS